MRFGSIFWVHWTHERSAILDYAAITRACERFGVARLRIFGSAASGGFDPERSDLDFFVDFLPEVHDLLGNYLALTEELETIVGRKVDLVMSDASSRRCWLRPDLRHPDCWSQLPDQRAMSSSVTSTGPSTRWVTRMWLPNGSRSAQSMP